ncbi:MAG TPA: hypothetical protein VKT49_13490 [Bryobacteraceae bacterium]|nr:hypothetical protein [Bryobacteraceae bacterium]
MLPITADSASVRWDSKKKNWTASIKVGAEVIRRSPGRPMPADAGDDVLRSWVIQTAKDEGYEIIAGGVSIER